MKHWPDQISGLASAHIADGKLFLTLNNTLAAVDDGRQEILRFLGPVAAMPLNRLETIFEEMVSNIIRHGFGRNSGQCIHVVVERGLGAIQLTFEDDGIPFDLLAVALPVRPASTETARIGGLGIPLIVKLSSTLSYEALQPDASADFCPRNRTIVTVAV